MLLTVIFYISNQSVMKFFEFITVKQRFSTNFFFIFHVRCTMLLCKCPLTFYIILKQNLVLFVCILKVRVYKYHCTKLL